MTYDVHALQTIARAAQAPDHDDNVPEYPGPRPGPIHEPPRYLSRMHSACDPGWYDLRSEPNAPPRGVAVAVSRLEPPPHKPGKEAPKPPDKDKNPFREMHAKLIQIRQKLQGIGQKIRYLDPEPLQEALSGDVQKNYEALLKQLERFAKRMKTLDQKNQLPPRDFIFEVTAYHEKTIEKIRNLEYQLCRLDNRQCDNKRR
jgi:hypothetical protein